MASTLISQKVIKRLLSVPTNGDSNILAYTLFSNCLFVCVYSEVEWWSGSDRCAQRI